MKLSRKHFKHLKHHLVHHRKFRANKLDQIVAKLPYKEASVERIQRHGKKLIKPVEHRLARDNRYNDSDSRVLGFGFLKKIDHLGDVLIDGMVAGYRLVYSKFYHQVALYILLKNVSGKTYLGHFKYLTDHLWINPNSSNRVVFIRTFTIGIGDYVTVEGKPNEYSGHIGSMNGIKVSLDDAIITNVGYPYIKNHHFTHLVVPYNHGQQFIYKVNAKMHPNVILGQEVSLKDRAIINTSHMLVGYSDAYVLGKVIHKGMDKKLYQKNPRLVLTYDNQNHRLIHSIRWTTNQYSIKHGTVLTSAKALQNHPKGVELKLDAKLADTIHYSRVISFHKAVQEAKNYSLS